MIWPKFLKIIFSILLSLLVACSGVKSKRVSPETPEVKPNQVAVGNFLELSDKSGKFKILKESGMINKGKTLVVKKKMFANGESDKKLLEKSITISTLGVLSKKIRVLRPDASQYTVWLDGQKFFSEMKLDPKSKSMKLRLVSPEEKWNGEQLVKFPDGTGVFCFFSQLFECVSTTSFFKKAVENGSGRMNFHLIWDGYPYLAEQYGGVPDELFTNARMEYDGVNDLREHRFSLKFNEQEIFYLLTTDLSGAKIYWVSEGYTLIPQKK